MEDRVVVIKDIFRDLHPERRQNVASLEATEGERIKPKEIMTEEVVVDRGREED